MFEIKVLSYYISNFQKKEIAWITFYYNLNKKLLKKYTCKFQHFAFAL